MGFTVLAKGADIMKKFVLTVMAVVAIASPAFAQSGDISSYSDAAGTSCNITDASVSVLSVYLLHKHTSGATASQFTVTPAGGAVLTYLSVAEAPGMLRIGNANDDMSLAYGGCITGDFLIATVTYLGSGTSAPCSRITLTPAPSSAIPGELAMVDCASPSGNLAVPGNGVAIINPNVTCQCDVPVQAKTWGSIKALYR
jgi:hypothetical protein